MIMRPHDFGPIYFETDLTRLPVEPWNTASNLIFLAIGIYFFYKLRRSKAQLEILKFALPVLLLGFVGGTVFHSTRSHSIWLVLDFVPIMILCLAASLHFLNLLLKNRLHAAISILLLFVGIRFVRGVLPLPLHLKIAAGYSMLAAVIVLPALIYCASCGWRRVGYLFGALLSFAIAIFFRSVDPQGLIPMGTHFLWHLFGGLSTFLMVNYIYLEGEERGEGLT